MTELNLPSREDFFDQLHLHHEKVKMWLTVLGPSVLIILFILMETFREFAWWGYLAPHTIPVELISWFYRTTDVLFFRISLRPLLFFGAGWILYGLIHWFYLTSIEESRCQEQGYRFKDFKAFRSLKSQERKKSQEMSGPEVVRLLLVFLIIFGLFIAYLVYKN